MEIDPINLCMLWLELTTRHQCCVELKLELAAKNDNYAMLNSLFDETTEEVREKDKLITDLMCIISVFQEEQEEYTKW